jgi:hypothetical protein
MARFQGKHVAGIAAKLACKISSQLDEDVDLVRDIVPVV